MLTVRSVGRATTKWGHAAGVVGLGSGRRPAAAYRILLRTPQQSASALGSFTRPSVTLTDPRIKAKELFIRVDVDNSIASACPNRCGN